MTSAALRARKLGTGRRQGAGWRRRFGAVPARMASQAQVRVPPTRPPPDSAAVDAWVASRNRTTARLATEPQPRDSAHSRSHGTSYVYGHACHHHVCSFTRLKDTSVGDQVTVTTAAATLTYRIARIGLSPKAATSLPSWASTAPCPTGWSWSPALSSTATPAATTSSSWHTCKAREQPRPAARVRCSPQG
jgi:hypothetical protein